MTEATAQPERGTPESTFVDVLLRMGQHGAALRRTRVGTPWGTEQDRDDYFDSFHEEAGE